jgi:hypothetical protein
MSILRANFKADLISMARQHLTEQWGPVATQFPDEQAVIIFFDSLRRRPAVRPRKVWLADDFCCPPDQQGGWNNLREKVSNGADIAPHLSTRHESVTYLDGLLNEWGVHHFHLGTKLHGNPKHSYYVERTGPLLFAMVREDDFYAINIYQHNAFERPIIIESIHRNWPQAIRKYRVNGICGEMLTEEQRKHVRRVNCGTLTTVSDGTVYMPIGGGVCSSGEGLEAVLRARRLLGEVKRLQCALEDRVASFIPELRTCGYTGAPEINAKLVGITQREYKVLFPDYRVLANVMLLDVPGLASS